MPTRSFELMDGKSDKFWTITVDARQHRVNFGRRGTTGQTQAKDFTSPEAAKAASRSSSARS
jgi:predicted DNA-binding WGR domain protein